MSLSLPPEIEIKPRPAFDTRVRVPGSKSISNRVLLLSALADGRSSLRGLLDCDDTRVMVRALSQLGATFEGEMADVVTVDGVAGRPEVPTLSTPLAIDVHASGTAARFLTAALALVPAETVLDGTARMRERPINDLVSALVALGVDMTIEGQNGCPPIRCRGGRPFGGEVKVDASKSSQYVSALLQIAPFAALDVVLELKDGVLVSRPYVDVTLDVMRTFGASARFIDDRRLHVSCQEHYQGIHYVVEPDASTAAYFFCAAAITGGRIRVEDLPGRSSQADMGLLSVLEQMGAQVQRTESSVTVQGPLNGVLQGVNVDMNSMPDAVLALAVTAAFASGPTHIRNVANLRIKETDRLQALETELRKLGVDAHAESDALRIQPGPLHGATIATYDDHRMAMAFALAGLRVPGVIIRDPGCISKSWPGYFDAFARL
ncbi:MAG: 3-phosphoshikimate 1-carboxyvinyltransferase [Polyangiales bacterium]